MPPGAKRCLYICWRVIRSPGDSSATEVRTIVHISGTAANTVSEAIHQARTGVVLLTLGSH